VEASDATKVVFQ